METAVDKLMSFLNINLNISYSKVNLDEGNETSESECDDDEAFWGRLYRLGFQEEKQG